MTHTPGPWAVSHIKSGPKRFIEARRADGRKVFVAETLADNDDANAYLMASAPTMLKALKDIAHGLFLPGNDDCREVEAAIKARCLAAIARAEGRES